MARRLAISSVLATAALATAPRPASAELVALEPPRGMTPPPKLARQVQLDFGLAVVGVGYEHPVAPKLALQVEAQIFGTYFLPWFDAGDNGRGFGGELRATWFASRSGHGLYLLGYGRLDAVRISRDDLRGDGLATSGGAAVGWAFRLAPRFDLRLGLGAQYIYMRADADGTRLGASTLFPTIDGVLGYRL